MTPTENARQAERDALLNRLMDALRNDSRVVAAWLFGSLGRGAGDALSDIDLWVIVEDAAFPSVLADLPAFVASLCDAPSAPPILTREEPYNAPTGGGYLTVIFDGPDYSTYSTGAHLTDWYFQPQRGAHLPPQTRLVFDRANLPTKDEAPAFGNPDVSREGVAAAVHGLNFGWMMIAICAKYAARSPDEPEMSLLSYALHGLNEARQFLRYNPLLAAEFAPHQTPSAKIAVLRRVAALLAEMQDALAERGGAISPGIADATERFLNTVETILRETKGARK